MIDTSGSLVQKLASAGLPDHLQLDLAELCERIDDYTSILWQLVVHKGDNTPGLLVVEHKLVCSCCNCSCCDHTQNPPYWFRLASGKKAPYSNAALHCSVGLNHWVKLVKGEVPLGTNLALVDAPILLACAESVAGILSAVDL